MSVCKSKTFNCINDALKAELPCDKKSCRYWIDYSKDMNCTHIAIKNNGAMKLHQIGRRLKLTAARIKQIETSTLKKIFKKTNKESFLSKDDK